VSQHGVGVWAPCVGAGQPGTTEKGPEGGGCDRRNCPESARRGSQHLSFETRGRNHSLLPWRECGLMEDVNLKSPEWRRVLNPRCLVMGRRGPPDPPRTVSDGQAQPQQCARCCLAPNSTAACARSTTLSLPSSRPWRGEGINNAPNIASG